MQSVWRAKALISITAVLGLGEISREGIIMRLELADELMGGGELCAAEI